MTKHQDQTDKDVADRWQVAVTGGGNRTKKDRRLTIDIGNDRQDADVDPTDFGLSPLAVAKRKVPNGHALERTAQCRS